MIIKLIKLWKENRVDQEYEMDINEIAKRFKESKYYTEYFKQGWPLDRALPLFICSRDGLNSVNDVKDYETIREAVRDYIRK